MYAFFKWIHFIWKSLHMDKGVTVIFLSNKVSSQPFYTIQVQRIKKYNDRPDGNRTFVGILSPISTKQNTLYEVGSFYFGKMNNARNVGRKRFYRQILINNHQIEVN